MVIILVNLPLGMVLQERLVFEIVLAHATYIRLAKSLLQVLESRVASVGHRRPELLAMRGGPFWRQPRVKVRGFDWCWKTPGYISVYTRHFDTQLLLIIYNQYFKILTRVECGKIVSTHRHPRRYTS